MRSIRIFIKLRCSIRGYYFWLLWVLWEIIDCLILIEKEKFPIWHPYWKIFHAEFFLLIHLPFFFSSFPFSACNLVSVLIKVYHPWLCSECAVFIWLSFKFSSLHCTIKTSWKNYGTWSSSWWASFSWLSGAYDFHQEFPARYTSFPRSQCSNWEHIYIFFCCLNRCLGVL